MGASDLQTGEAAFSSYAALFDYPMHVLDSVSHVMFSLSLLWCLEFPQVFTSLNENSLVRGASRFHMIMGA